MNNNTVQKKVTLRPSQIKKVDDLSKEDRFNNNFSLTLRHIIDNFKTKRIENDRTTNTKK